MSRFAIDLSPIWNSESGVKDWKLLKLLVDSLSKNDAKVAFVVDVKEELYEFDTDSLNRLLLSFYEDPESFNSRRDAFLDLEIQMTNISSNVNFLLYDAWWVVGTNLSFSSLKRINLISQYTKCGLIIHCKQEEKLHQNAAPYDPSLEYATFSVFKEFQKVVLIQDLKSIEQTCGDYFHDSFDLAIISEDDWVYMHSSKFGIVLRNNLNSKNVIRCTGSDKDFLSSILNM